MKKPLYLVAAVLLASTTGAGAQVSESPQPPLDVTNADHPSYSDCGPPPSFAKRFPALTLKKAIKKIDRKINHESPSLIESNNPVTGASVSSNDLYATSNLGFKSYDNNHTYTFIGQALGGPRNHSMRISDTNYSHGSKVLAANTLKKIYINHGSAITGIPIAGESEIGFCSSPTPGQAAQCFSTANGSFDVPQDLFQQLANSNPSKPIKVTALRKDGTMSPCPLYFSPVSFQATLATIEEAYAKAAAKRERQAASGI